MDVPSATQDPHLFGDPCGRLHLVFRDSGPHGTRWLYASWSDDGWTSPAPEMRELAPGSGVVVADDAGDLHFIFDSAVRDSTGLRSSHMHYPRLRLR